MGDEKGWGLEGKEMWAVLGAMSVYSVVSIRVQCTRVCVFSGFNLTEGRERFLQMTEGQGERVYSGTRVSEEEGQGYERRGSEEWETRKDGAWRGTLGEWSVVE